MRCRRGEYSRSVRAVIGMALKFAKDELVDNMFCPVFVDNKPFSRIGERSELCAEDFGAT